MAAESPLERQPSVSDYAAAIEDVADSLTPDDRHLLAAMADGSGWSAEDVGRLYGSESYRVGNHRLGRLGKLFDEALGGVVQENSKGWRPYWAVLATGQQRSSGEFEWRLRPEVCSALGDRLGAQSPESSNT